MSKTVTLSNSGTAGLTWAARTNQNWCRLNTFNGRLDAGGRMTFDVLVDAPPKAGATVCTVTVADSNADNSPQTITVNYTVSE